VLGTLTVFTSRIVLHWVHSVFTQHGPADWPCRAGERKHGMGRIGGEARKYGMGRGSERIVGLNPQWAVYFRGNISITLVSQIWFFVVN
jgi:hypothetical protein